MTIPHDRLKFDKLLSTPTHLYSHTARAHSSLRFGIAALWGQKPIIRSKGEQDEDSSQSPKEPCKKQRHTKLHGPGFTRHLDTGCQRWDRFLQLLQEHVTERGRNNHSFRILVNPQSKFQFILSFLILTLFLSLCLCYGRTRLNTWLLWTLLGSLACQPTLPSS